MTKFRTEFFECGCYSPDHLMKVSGEPDWGHMTFCLQLSHYLPWYRRVWVAFKYAVGWRSAFACDWADCLVELEDVPRLKKIVDEFLVEGTKYKEEWENQND